MAQHAGDLREGTGNADDWLACDGTYANKLIYPDYTRRVGGLYGRHGITFERLPIMDGFEICVRDAPVTDPPANVDVPHASQTGDTLSCTMGNWDNEPTGYAYRWLLDDTDEVGSDATYVVKADDAGRSATCIVTAINAIGATDAPPSNAVIIAVAPADPPPEVAEEDLSLTLRIPEPPAAPAPHKPRRH